MSAEVFLAEGHHRGQSADVLSPGTKWFSAKVLFFETEYAGQQKPVFKIVKVE